MVFGLWKKKLQQTTPEITGRARSTASYGGMQERVIQARLEILVDAVLTRHRSVIEPARALSKFSLVEQERFLDSVDRLSLCDQEFAFQFCQSAIPALIELNDSTWNLWIKHLLEVFNSDGIDAGITCINDSHAYQQDQIPASSSVSFSEVSRVLEIFIRALNGRELKLATAEQSYTDTETLFLPEQINHFPTRDENFSLYKSLLTHQWAQTWFGTWHVNLSMVLKNYADQKYALDLFHALETLRLDACLQRELPGIAREMAMLRSNFNEVHPLWCKARKELQQPEATVQTTLGCLSQLYDVSLKQDYALYQGKLHTEQTAAVITQRGQRGQREQSALQKELDELRRSITEQPTELIDPSSTRQPGFSVTQQNSNEDEETQLTQLRYDDNVVDITPELQTLLNSIGQDNNEIPEHYLNTTNNNLDDKTALVEPVLNKNETYDLSYDEWDHSRQRYRKNWCLIQEQSVTPVTGNFVSETLNKYQIVVKQLRRTFEALRQENQKLKREPSGDDIDIDALVEAWSDTKNGLEASERLFIQTRRESRNVAVMFMIDMSSSTTGWINQVERESLVLLCEALELLGDRYAIYGFSGHNNTCCQCFHIKDFNENYSDEVRSRIAGIKPHDYTRMGAAIRHLGKKLSQQEARTHLFIALSDGRPDDIGGYRGRYGIEDTRMALIELKHLGINTYCITIDTSAGSYLPHMFGKNDYTIIRQVNELPRQITDIYRRLTQ